MSFSENSFIFVDTGLPNTSYDFQSDKTLFWQDLDSSQNWVQVKTMPVTPPSTKRTSGWGYISEQPVKAAWQCEGVKVKGARFCSSVSLHQWPRCKTFEKISKQAHLVCDPRQFLSRRGQRFATTIIRWSVPTSQDVIVEKVDEVWLGTRLFVSLENVSKRNKMWQLSFLALEQCILMTRSLWV